MLAAHPHPLALPVTVAYCFIKRDFSRLSEFTLFAATPFAATAVLADVLIAGSLCILLHGSRTGFRRTDALVTTLIVYAVNRCLLTATAAVVEVIVFSLRSYALWYLAIDFVIGKLYANSFLASLNSRQALQTRAGPSIHTGTHTDIEFESRPVSGSSAHGDIALLIASIPSFNYLGFGVERRCSGPPISRKHRANKLYSTIKTH
ncbi:hypothetical protein EST38_g3576 [Candolleomyces aberdarensis]|uniref:DUF6534 domain-containing protein n=1 Tax=Candolleomyces aberdarensis TaxID=2316362 RepID=A0A4Q2DQ71_9AGAR|nr:hypothetical protein EST38_g3576 [Candolleomyces aberdarensis]